MDEIVTQLVDRLGCRLREEFEERAAIVEFDGGHSREHAECLALLEILGRHSGVLAGVVVVEVEVDGDAVWLLATGSASPRPDTVIDTSGPSRARSARATACALRFDNERLYAVVPVASV